MAKNPAHRPRKNTPDRVAAAVDQVIQEYKETGDIKALHDIHLLEVLGNISIDTLEKYYNGKADAALAKDIQDNIQDINQDIIQGESCTKQSYTGALKKLISFRQLVCLEHLTSDRFNTGWIFLSKQPHWGNFTDVQRVESKGKQEITVSIAGPDGAALRE